MYTTLEGERVMICQATVMIIRYKSVIYDTDKFETRHQFHQSIAKHQGMILKDIRLCDDDEQLPPEDVELAKGNNDIIFFI